MSVLKGVIGNWTQATPAETWIKSFISVFRANRMQTYEYLGIFEADTIKQVEMKDKIKKEYLRRTRKLLEIKLSNRNLIKKINRWDVPSLDIRDPLWSEPEMNSSK